MGSTGSGSFSDYSGSKQPDNASKGAGASGGASGVDRCKQAFSCVLEEVAQCDYYTTHKAVPAPGTQLGIIVAGRVFAIDANGTKVGAFPTSFNYLAGCLVDGVTYIGIVKSSAIAPMPSIEGDFVPQ